MRLEIEDLKKLNRMSWQWGDCQSVVPSWLRLKMLYLVGKRLSKIKLTRRLFCHQRWKKEWQVSNRLQIRFHVRDIGNYQNIDNYREMQVVGKEGVIPLAKMLGFGWYLRISRKKQSVSVELLFCFYWISGVFLEPTFCFTWTSNGIILRGIVWPTCLKLSFPTFKE